MKEFLNKNKKYLIVIGYTLLVLNLANTYFISSSNAKYKNDGSFAYLSEFIRLDGDDLTINPDSPNGYYNLDGTTNPDNFITRIEVFKNKEIAKSDPYTSDTYSLEVYNDSDNITSKCIIKAGKGVGNNLSEKNSVKFSSSDKEEKMTFLVSCPLSLVTSDNNYYQKVIIKERIDSEKEFIYKNGSLTVRQDDYLPENYMGDLKDALKRYLERHYLPYVSTDGKNAINNYIQDYFNGVIHELKGVSYTGDGINTPYNFTIEDNFYGYAETYDSTKANKFEDMYFSTTDVEEINEAFAYYLRNFFTKYESDDGNLYPVTPDMVNMILNYVNTNFEFVNGAAYFVIPDSEGNFNSDYYIGYGIVKTLENDSVIVLTYTNISIYIEYLLEDLGYFSEEEIPNDEEIIPPVKEEEKEPSEEQDPGMEEEKMLEEYFSALNWSEANIPSSLEESFLKHKNAESDVSDDYFILYEEANDDLYIAKIGSIKNERVSLTKLEITLPLEVNKKDLLIFTNNDSKLKITISLPNLEDKEIFKEVLNILNSYFKTNEKFKEEEIMGEEILTYSYEIVK